MTKDQLIHFLSTKKAQKLLEATTWSDLTAALGGLTTEEKDKIAKLVATGGGQTVINRLQSVMRENAMEAAKLEATQAFSDDNLSLTELESLL